MSKQEIISTNISEWTIDLSAKNRWKRLGYYSWYKRIYWFLKGAPFLGGSTGTSSELDRENSDIVT